MTNSIVRELKKKFREMKSDTFVMMFMKKLVKLLCYGVQMGIGNMLSKYQYPFVPRSIAIWRVFSSNSQSSPNNQRKFDTSSLISRI